MLFIESSGPLRSCWSCGRWYCLWHYSALMLDRLSPRYISRLSMVSLQSSNRETLAVGERTRSMIKENVEVKIYWKILKWGGQLVIFTGRKAEMIIEIRWNCSTDYPGRSRLSCMFNLSLDAAIRLSWHDSATKARASMGEKSSLEKLFKTCSNLEQSGSNPI